MDLRHVFPSTYTFDPSLSLHMHVNSIGANFGVKEIGTVDECKVKNL